MEICWSQLVSCRGQNLASKTKQPFYWGTRWKCCIILQKQLLHHITGYLLRQWMTLEESVRNMSTSVRASVFSAGCASKQKKSSSWLALPQTLSVSCDVVAVCCCTAVAYSYVKLRDAAVLASPSQCSLNCSKVTLAMISSLRSLHLVNRVPRTDKIASVSGPVNLTPGLKMTGKGFYRKWVKSSFEQFITMQTRVGSTNGWIISQNAENLKFYFLTISGNLQNLWRHHMAKFRWRWP